MSKILITGGTAQQIDAYARVQLKLGDHVILLHDFPGDSLLNLPSGAVAVLDIIEDGLSPSEVAEIFGAKRIVDLGYPGAGAPKPVPKMSKRPLNPPKIIVNEELQAVI